jgi:hypothetical protein
MVAANILHVDPTTNDLRFDSVARETAVAKLLGHAATQRRMTRDDASVKLIQAEEGTCVFVLFCVACFVWSCVCFSFMSLLCRNGTADGSVSTRRMLLCAVGVGSRLPRSGRKVARCEQGDRTSEARHQGQLVNNFEPTLLIHSQADPLQHSLCDAPRHLQVLVVSGLYILFQP